MKFCPLFAFYWSNVFSALSDVDGIFVSRSTFSPRSSSHLGCFTCWLTSAAAAYSTTRRVCSSSLGFSLADRLSYNSTFRLAIIMKLWGSIPILLVAILTLAAVTGKHFLSFKTSGEKGKRWRRSKTMISDVLSWNWWWSGPCRNEWEFPSGPGFFFFPLFLDIHSLKGNFHCLCLVTWNGSRQNPQQRSALLLFTFMFGKIPINS